MVREVAVDSGAQGLVRSRARWQGVAQAVATLAGEGCSVRWEWEEHGSGLRLGETEEQGEQGSLGGKEWGRGLFNGVGQMKGLPWKLKSRRV